MPSSVFGLPLHPLVVHATVIVVPTAAIVVLLAAVWPRFRRWAGYLPIALAAAAVILVPISTSSGESLQESMPETALIEQHAELADQLLPVVIALLVVALLQAWLFRTGRTGWLLVATMVLSIVIASATVVEVVRIGHSGAKAAWSNVSTGS